MAKSPLSILSLQAVTNRRIVAEWVRANPEIVQSPTPRGGVTAFPRLCTEPDVEGFCHELLDGHGVLLFPGASFGFPDRVRLGFGGPTPELRHGLQLIDRVLGRRRARRFRQGAEPPAPPCRASCQP